MSFKDMFERYKNGEATEEEIARIEEELEKNEMINEYLSRTPLNGLGDELLKDTRPIEIINIQKTVNKKFRKIIFTSIAWVLGIILGNSLILQPLLHKMYYNPIGFTIKDWEGVQFDVKSRSNFFIDTATYTELHFPGYITEYGTMAEAVGVGEYRSKIIQKNTFNNQESISDQRLSKERLIDADYSYNKFPSRNVFNIKADEYYYKADVSEDQENIKKLLNELPTGSVVSAYITFENTLRLKDVMEFENKNKVYSQWICIENNSIDKIGFNPTGFGSKIDDNDIDKSIYPNFKISVENGDDVRNETVLENHFTSMIKYMSTRERYLDIYGKGNSFGSRQYKEILEYIESNGINSYGVLVYADAETIIKLMNDPIVNYVKINDAKFSVLQN